MSLYHLHIPRTSGIYIKNFIVPNLNTRGIPHFASNRTDIDENVIKSSQFVIGHFGKMPISLMDNPTVFTLLRDPVERFLSYFKYTTGVNLPKDVVMNKLHYWLYESDIQHNMQSKFLTGSMNIDKFNNSHRYHNASVDNGWWIEDYSLSIDDIKSSLDSMYSYTMDKHDIFKEDFNKALNKEFGFSIFQNNYKANEHLKRELDLSNSIINRIKEVNSIDQEVYEYVRSIKKRY